MIHVRSSSAVRDLQKHTGLPCQQRPLFWCTSEERYIYLADGFIEIPFCQINSYAIYSITILDQIALYISTIYAVYLRQLNTVVIFTAHCKTPIKMTWLTEMWPKPLHNCRPNYSVDKRAGRKKKQAPDWNLKRQITCEWCHALLCHLHSHLMAIWH